MPVSLGRLIKTQLSGRYGGILEPELVHVANGLTGRPTSSF